MENILYLDDYINLYNKKNNIIINYKPYKKTLCNGIIKDKNKFIKIYKKILDKYKLKRNFFNESIYVIINNLYYEEDKQLLREILEELNYRKIRFINELDLIKVNSKTLYINYNYSYFNFCYIDLYGDVIINNYRNDDINKRLFSSIIKYINKKNIILYGNNKNEVIKKLKNKNYYTYSDDNILINLLNSKKI